MCSALGDVCFVPIADMPQISDAPVIQRIQSAIKAVKTAATVMPLECFVNLWSHLVCLSFCTRAHASASDFDWKEQEIGVRPLRLT